MHQFECKRCNRFWEAITVLSEAICQGDQDKVADALADFLERALKDSKSPAGKGRPAEDDS